MAGRVELLLPALSPGSPARGASVDPAAPLAWTVDGVLSLEECVRMIDHIEALGPAPAPITTAQGFVMAPDTRNNTRVQFDDPALAAELYRRVQDTLPATLFGRRPVGANERFRCYRYRPGQFFAPHFDGAFRRSATEQSELSFLVYLNAAGAGGATRFHGFDVDVVPRAGLALLFQHRLLHEGAPVVEGVKYVLRSDVMYRA